MIAFVVESRAMTYAEFNILDSCPHALQIDKTGVRLLWHSDYWDGPMSGMVRYRGEECWLQMIAENEGGKTTWYRRFTLLRLTPEQYDDECYWHKLFRRHVGYHTDYAENGCELEIGTPPDHQPALFYDAFEKHTPPDYSECEVLGWFED